MSRKNLLDQYQAVYHQGVDIDNVYLKSVFLDELQLGLNLAELKYHFKARDYTIRSSRLHTDRGYAVPTFGLHTSRYRTVYPFPGYDLRTGRGVKLAVSLNVPQNSVQNNYHEWLVAPPIDGGSWKPVFLMSQAYFSTAEHRRMLSRLQNLYSMLDSDSGQRDFRLKATVYQKILQDASSGAGLYAKLNMLSESIDRSFQIPESQLAWTLLPVVETQSGDSALKEFLRMLSLADEAAQKDEVFLSGNFSPLDAPFLIAASEEQLPRYREGKYENRIIEMSVVVVYGSVTEQKHIVQRFVLPPKNVLDGSNRCFPNESVLIEFF